MKKYLLITGSLFALLAVAHLARTVDEGTRLRTDPWFWLEGPGIVAAALCFWAWRLHRTLA